MLVFRWLPPSLVTLRRVRSSIIGSTLDPRSGDCGDDGGGGLVFSWNLRYMLGFCALSALDRLSSFFSGPDADSSLNALYKDLAVPDFAGFGGFDNCLYAAIT